MGEGYPESNSENPDDSTTEADDNFNLVLTAVEDILREIKNGCERTTDDLSEDLMLAVAVFRATEQITINEWTPRLAAIRELLDHTGTLMEHQGMSVFSQWFKTQARSIDAIFGEYNDTETDHIPTVAIAEQSNSNHLLDWPLR